MTTAEKIKASDLTLNDLADQAGVPYATARRWSLGQSEPKLNQIAALARALGCEPADLIPEVT